QSIRGVAATASQAARPSQGIFGHHRHCYYPHAYCLPNRRLFYYQASRESSSIRFVVKSSPTGLTLSNTHSTR
ncbi:hypothetical protein, partial [Klebsiella pneumoniae]|uniref:hypothetical protein n=1 Tax=Klebsiella pneumoniae TaxID=573 RepID=UPI00197ACC02